MKKIPGPMACSLAALAAFLAVPTSAQIGSADAARPMGAVDLVTMPRVGAPVVSPDGQHMVYGVTTTDPESYARSTTLYWRPVMEMDAEPIALDLGGDANSAAFAPDGSLYFLSGRANASGDKKSRIWRTRISPAGVAAAPEQVTDFAADISGFAVAPTGGKLAVWGEISRECTTFGCEGDGTAHLTGPGTGRLYEGDTGFIRHWDTWETPGTYSRVFVYDITGGKASGSGTPVDGPAGTEALTGDTPTKPFGGGEDVAWAADGKGIYFVAREANAEEPTSTDTDIYYADLSGGAPRNLTNANEAFDLSPAPSPDGRYLAYLAMARPNYEADRQVVQLRDLRTGKTRALTQNFDRSFGSLAWTPDGRWIIATAQDVLDTPAFRIDPRNGKVARLDLMAGNEAHIGNVKPLSGNRLLFTQDSIGAPAEIFLSENWGQALPITHVAKGVVGELASIETKRFSFAGANGDTVWGQITKLENQDGPMPAILYVHGGPQGSFNDGWSSRWNPRVVASQGYAVISVDFHGSTGYGQDFTDSINRDWGGKPLEDLKLGLAAALAQDSQIDGSKACAMGASYGGFMMNWIAGQWPDRFDCLVQHDGLFDMRSFYYVTEELWFPRWDFGGSYAEQTEQYERFNPVNYVDQWKTPMLMITGEQDFRVPYTQGIASFTALQERGIDSQLLVFPDENHWVLKPKNSLQWHNVVFDWLAKYLKDGEGSAAE